MRFYVASGWFTENQEKSRLDILNVLLSLKIELFNVEISFFSPKEECLCKKDDNTNFQSEVFNKNIHEIEFSDAVIVNTTEKDIGTIFEAGVAYEKNKDIIYYCPGLKGNFNLMLARSGIAVATNVDELKNHIKRYILTEGNYYSEYKGHIE